jgi:hypothetical protein
MSERASKRLHRDLRRVVGVEAIEVIDAHSKTLAHQVIPNLNALQARVEGIDLMRKVRESDMDARLGDLEHHSSALREQASDRRQWRARLRWLLTGC